MKSKINGLFISLVILFLAIGIGLVTAELDLSSANGQIACAFLGVGFVGYLASIFYEKKNK